MKTACEGCRYHYSEGTIWYSNWCHHPDSEWKKWDCVTGETTTEHKYCRDVNDGNCRLRKEDSINAPQSKD